MIARTFFGSLWDLACYSGYSRISVNRILCCWNVSVVDCDSHLSCETLHSKLCICILEHTRAKCLRNRKMDSRIRGISLVINFDCILTSKGAILHESINKKCRKAYSDLGLRFREKWLGRVPTSVIQL